MTARHTVLLLLTLALFIAATAFGQARGRGKENIIEEILTVAGERGMEGFKSWIKMNNHRVRSEDIMGLALSGVEKRLESLLSIALLLAKNKGDDFTYAFVLYETGKYFKLLSNTRKATDYYSGALHRYQKVKNPGGQARVYYDMGDMYYTKGETAKAREMQTKALHFFKKSGEPLGQIQVYNFTANLYHVTGEIPKALEMCDKVLRLSKKHRSPAGRGSAYKCKGNIYAQTGENSKALKMYDKALYFFEKAGMVRGRGDIYQGKGNVFFYTGDYAAATGMYDKALSLFQKTGNPLGKGHVYLRKGMMCLETGESSKAFDNFDKSMTFYEKAGNPVGKGNVYLNKGLLYVQISDSLKAFEMFNKGLVLFEKAGELLGQGNIYQEKGDRYLNSSFRVTANEMYDKALALFEKAGSPVGRGNIWLRKGALVSGKGEDYTALDMYKRALVFFEKAGYLGGQGMVYMAMGAFYGERNEHAKALEMYDQGMPFFKKFHSSSGRGGVELLRGMTYLKSGQTSKALNVFDKARAAFNQSGSIGAEAYVFHGKARALAKIGKNEDARRLFEKGIQYQEKVRTQTAFSEMKKLFMDEVYEQYEKTLLFMLENGYDDNAFKTAESMRARVFLDQMAEGLVTLDKGLEPRLKEERDKLVTKLSLLSKKIHEAPSGGDEEKYRQLKEGYRKTGHDLEELLIKIRLGNPLYASVRYPRPITVPELQKEVLKEGELLLRYVTSAEGTYAFLVSGERFKVIPLDIKEKELKRMINTCLRALTENDSPRIKRYGVNLYRKLFKPLEPEIEKSKEIIIIPDGHLEKIPLESFIFQKEASGRPVFLLEKYRIKYIQSASFLSILRKHYRRDGETKNFTAFGDPVYDYETFKQAKPVQAVNTGSGQPEDEIKQVLRSHYSRSGGTLGRLPASGEEVHAIAGLFKKHHHKATVYAREGATEENAKAPRMKNFDYIHFACHGLLNENFQSLVLSQLPKDKSTEDGYFTLNEIMNCDYNAKLIVLSACRTGSGKMERAEGVTGLTRAVMYAGTPAVVASLWNVDDRATKELMLYFYRNLLEKNMTKSEALRQAKLELMKDKKYRSPYFWSAFVMYGE